MITDRIKAKRDELMKWYRFPRSWHPHAHHIRRALRWELLALEQLREALAAQFLKLCSPEPPPPYPPHPNNPLIVSQAMYDAAKASGLDVSNCVVRQPIPLRPVKG